MRRLLSHQCYDAACTVVRHLVILCQIEFDMSGTEICRSNRSGVSRPRSIQLGGDGLFFRSTSCQVLEIVPGGLFLRSWIGHVDDLAALATLFNDLTQSA